MKISPDVISCKRFTDLNNRLHDITSGEIFIQGKSITKAHGKALLEMRRNIERFTDLNSVDFPAPDSPTMTANSPFSIFKLIFFKPT
jgi:ABC-type oligopeptide transport system ATPase subunit